MKQQKRTKIIATLAHKTCTVELVTKLYEAGVDVIRINTAHATFEGTKKIVDVTRSVSDRIALLIDTKGPEVRTWTQEIEVTEGQIIAVVGTEEEDYNLKNTVQVTYPYIAQHASVGKKIIINDGEVTLRITEIIDNEIKAEVLNSGTIKARKTVNVPGVELDMPALTPKDKEFLKIGAELGIDFIAHSFVRSRKDVREVKQELRELGSNAKIIAKIENRQGVDNIDEILDETYAVMVARGDLGVELPAEEVPIIQKRLIKKCIARARPVIIATQMLESMITNPRPTRAEVSDVANGVYESADALMLSGETANGEYPVEAVETMTKVIKKVEAQLSYMHELPSIMHRRNQVRALLAKTAVEASRELPAQAIIIPTKSGASARIVSSYRTKPIVYAKCFSHEVARQLRLSFGVYCEIIEHHDSRDRLVESALQKLLKKGNLEQTDLVVILGVTPGKAHGANFIEINTVKECLEGICEISQDIV